MSTSVKIVSIKKESGFLTVRLNVSHSNMETTLDQDLILVKTGKGWVATIGLDKFPEQKTMTEAIKKLSDWLIRLGEAMGEWKSDKIDLNDVEIKAG